MSEAGSVPEQNHPAPQESAPDSSSDQELDRIASAPVENSWLPPPPDASLQVAMTVLFPEAKPEFDEPLVQRRLNDRYVLRWMLGRGGFATVYEAWDEVLCRVVAIKVPRRDRFTSDQQLKEFLSEARTAAQLKHRSIVTIHDVCWTSDGLCFIVLDYLKGGTLATVLDRQRLAPDHGARLMAEVAEAVAYANQQGLVHRDLKPSNILLDADGHPFVSDFGLAAFEESPLLKNADVVGSPPYMAPEQIRGENHRLDGRTDLWALGVILYRMLTGRLPFRSDTGEYFEEILSREPKPLRQIDPAIPRDLERICLRCLAKRMSDRYSTATDLADELRAWLRRQGHHADAATVLVEPDSGSSEHVSSSATPSHASHPATKIVPKGLRAFNSQDANFYLELLPGPRDRDNLPESIRFWKHVLESTSPDNGCAVGLLYGPSGCGKSSFLKAGLIPHLDIHVNALYVEATPDDLEQRLLAALRRAYPALTKDFNLTEALLALRDRDVLPSGLKVVLVIDQFEQWLHANRTEETSELIQALRHCDGQRVQCVLSVRDDFGMAATRFMGDLEIPIVQGRNFATIDRFSVSHARKVLAEFGRAFGQLPDSSQERTAAQQKFLEQAVTGLTEDGKVIPVRLALFAEMVKDRPWTPQTLEIVGGAEGIGVTFLEETFGSRSANPNHLRHREAARRLLSALLPDQGTDIRGARIGRQVLAEVSGCGDQPREFDALLRILDTELRLITPTETDKTGIAHDSSRSGPSSAGSSTGVIVPNSSREKFYQLTHDYLVPSIRVWMSREQRETRRGRAEIRLSDCAALWKVRRENKQLPRWWECAAIRIFTQSSLWTPTEKELMKSANRYYLVRLVVALVLLTLAIATVNEVRGRMTAESLVALLLKSESSDIPDIIRALERGQRWTAPLLREVRPTSPREDLHREVALLRLEGQARDLSHILGMVPRLTPEQARVVAHELQPLDAIAESALWDQLQKADTPQEVLSVATIISASNPGDHRWDRAARGIAEQVVLLPPKEAVRWLENLMPIGSRLALDLQDAFTRFTQDDAKDRQRTYVAALGLEMFLRQEIAGLTRLLVDHARHASEFHCLLPPLLAARDTSLANVRNLSAELLNQIAAQGAGFGKPAADNELSLVDRVGNATLVELMLGEPATFRRMLQSSPDQTIRSSLIHRLALLEIPPATIVSLLETEPSPDVRAALLLSLGEYARSVIPTKLSVRIESQFQRFLNDAHAETHSAAKWLAARWGIEDVVGDPPTRPLAGRGWYTCGAGHTMVRIPGCLDYEFALSATEVTVAEYRRFNPDYDSAYGQSLQQFLDPKQMDQCPVIFISCYDAMQYCNWLTRREGMDESQCCYEELPDLRLLPKPKHLTLAGYRLPDFAEWQCGCLAGSTTQFSFGDSLRLLPQYAWYFSNSRQEGQHRARAVGTTKPNAFGLFDTYGNVWEWATNVERSELSHVLCGGSCDNEPVDLRPVKREQHITPEDRQIRVGFRVAQSVTQPRP